MSEIQMQGMSRRSFLKRGGGIVVGAEAGVEIPKIGRHAAILNPPQRDRNTLRIRPCSLRSIDKPHRALIEIQLPR